MSKQIEALERRMLFQENRDLTARLSNLKDENAKLKDENALLRRSLADARAKRDAAVKSAEKWHSLYDGLADRLLHPSRAAAAESRASLEERYSRLASPHERAVFRRKYGKELGLVGRR